MRYIDTICLRTLCECDIPDEAAERLGFEAERRLENYTTGADQVRKLRVAFPTDPGDAETVRRCLCRLISTAYQVERAREAAAAVTLANGAVAASGIVTSVSSGSESMSFASGATASSAIQSAAGDTEKEEALYGDIIRTYLSGVPDANGVQLLYMGRYPYVP